MVGTPQEQWMQRPASSSDMRAVQARVRGSEQSTPATSNKERPGRAGGKKRGLGRAGGGGQDDDPEEEESKRHHGQEASQASATAPVAMRSDIAEQVLALYALTGDEEADFEPARRAFVQSWDTMLSLIHI